MFDTRKKAIIVVGLGYGDEGKGTIVDYLVRKRGAKEVVRFSGGHQAGHNVISPSGIWHCFVQFGSGTFVPGVRTYLSSQMFIEPEAILAENKFLINEGVGDSLDRMVVDLDAAIITPVHKMVCQMSELSRGQKKFGSCGMGVGETVRDKEKGLAITVRDIGNERVLRDKMEVLGRARFEIAKKLLQNNWTEEMQVTYDYFLNRWNIDELVRVYADFVTRITTFDSRKQNRFAGSLDNVVIFEGSQGMLLDPKYGFPPHITKTDLTFAAAQRLLPESKEFKVERLGVLRAFATRHGTGPFVTEDSELTSKLSDTYNITNNWQGGFRVGWFDLVASWYAIEASGGVDSLAITNLDRLASLERVKVCTSYEYVGKRLSDLDKYFVCNSFGKNRVRITAIKKSKARAGSKRQNQLTKFLFNCQPLEFVEFGRENGGTGKIDIQSFLGFLESEKGLAAPISILSLGPRSNDKVSRHSH